MQWSERWERMNPEHVLERRQEQERRRIERSREWREQQAKEKLKELFKEPPSDIDNK